MAEKRLNTTSTTTMAQREGELYMWSDDEFEAMSEC